MRKPIKKNIEDVLPLTPTQEGMLFHFLKDVQSEFYFEQLSLEIPGKIDVPCFERAWNAVVETNEMLRTVFYWEKVEKPFQIVLKEHKVKPIYYDLCGQAPGDAGKALDEIKRKDRKEKFDLHKTEVPFRITLCKIADDKYEMIISNHHILYDGWSTGIILAEFLKSYDAFSSGKAWPKPVKTKFKEFVKRIQRRDLTAQKNYWEAYLSGFDTPVIFSIKGKPQPALKGVDNFAYRELRLSRDKLEDFVKGCKITLASLLYVAWGILLLKYNNSRDIVFGTTVSGRSGAGTGATGATGIEKCVGMFINTVPLRINKAIISGAEPGSGDGMAGFLEKLHRELREREGFETTSLTDIKSFSELKSNEDLFDTIVVVENYPLEKSMTENTGSALSIGKYSMYERTHYDFTVIISVIDDLKVNFYYNGELYSADAVEWLAGHFRNIIETLVNTPREELKNLNDIDILSDDEKKQLLVDFNGVEAAYLADKTLHQLFEEQSEQTPDRIALVGAAPRVSLSYKKLNEQSDGLACLLIEKGVLADSIVGIMVERSFEMIIGILGILKSGGAYLPIDPEYPQERIDYMLKDSGAKMMIGSAEERKCGSAEFVFSCFFLASSLPRFLASDSSNLVYIIYTSGTTGKPKGVSVEHRSAANTLWALQDAYPLRETDTYLLKTTYCFDVSAAELFGWFLGSGRLAILEPGGEKDAGVILDNIERFGVTHINFVPAMFNVFLDSLHPGNIRKADSLKYIFLAGEALLPGLVEQFRGLGLDAGIALENIYGPSEASIYASRYSLKCWRRGDNVPIGAPLTNVRLYILGLDGFPQPIGVAGELSIGGAGVARGYLNNPELTAEKFHPQITQIQKTKINKSFAGVKGGLFQKPPLVVYQTGDLARWLKDGVIEFLGRIDRQVKIRGFRIESGEIESRLMEYTGLKEVVVTTWEDRAGDKQLATYFVPSPSLPGRIDEKELQKFLSAKLPAYMIPSYFIQLDKLPLTASGKIDRKSLPLPSAEIVAGKTKYAAPRTDAEVKLVGIWSDILGIRREVIGIDDNFFERGGHSLRATGLAGRIHKTFDIQVPLAKLFDIPTIRGLAGYIAGAEAHRFRPLGPTGKKEYYALSPAQKRLFILQQMEGGVSNTAYNMTGLLLLEGPLEKDKFDHAFRKLIERHESLRTSFEILEEEPVQRIHDEVPFEIEYYNLSTDYTDYTDDKIHHSSFIIHHFIRAFDLSKAPLLRVGLFKLEKGEHILAIDMHHIIADGTSLEIAARDFMTIFNGGLSEPLRIQYRDYAQWLNEELTGETLKKQASYWRQQFFGEIPMLNLPLDFPRPAEQSFEGNTLRFEIGPGEVKTLTAFALQENATRAMVLLAVFNVLLAKISNRDEVVVGMPVAGRRHPDLQSLLGMFVNTLALLNEPRGEKTFKTFLNEVKERALESYENQEYPFESLVDLLEVRRDASRNPLFDVMFAYQNMDSRVLELGGFKVTPYEYERKTAKFDLYLESVEKGDILSFSLEYCTKLFKEETARRLIDYFLRTLRNALAAPDLPLVEIRIMGEEEEHSVMTRSWGPDDPIERDETVHLLFQEKVETMGSAASGTALVFRGREMSYSRLNAAANQLARVLRTRGVTTDTVVGLLTERSFELIVGMLAILKAGGAYLPIDPGYPEQRKKMMLEDAKVKLVLVTGGPGDSLSPVRQGSGDIEFLDTLDESIYMGDDSNLPYISKGSDLLYVIYTSGSTGIPKGVMLEHRNLVNLLHFQYRYTQIDFSSVLQFTTISFDVSFQEIFSTLIAGGKLYLIDEELRKNVPELLAFVGKNGIRTLFVPTSFFKFVLNEKEYIEKLPGVGHIVTAGEQLVVNDRCRNYLKEHNVYLHNHYGPSEAHVVTASTLNPRGEIPDRPSIGQPLSNTGIYIMDKSMHLMPINAAGELAITGVQVGRGYLNRLELTAERFGPQITLSTQINEINKTKINKSFAGVKGGLFQKPPLVVYKTGDLARWLNNGTIEFLGRIDHQVKIRGFRIELGEIESRLLNHESVKEAAVIDFELPSGDRALCAYIAPNLEILKEKKEDFIRQLREYLQEKLPAYMVPASLTVLDAIPLLPNQKVNRKALPKPEVQEMYGRYEAPRTEVEKDLVNIWAELLGISPAAVGIDDDFFHLGGHSLKATLMTSRLHRALNIKIPLTQVFKTPSVRGLAAFIREMRDVAGERYANIPPAEKRDYYPVSSAQKRLYLLEQMPDMAGGYNLCGVYRVKGVLDKTRLEDTFRQMIDRHESFRTSFVMVSGEPVQRIQDVLLTKVFGPTFFQKGGSFDLSRAPLLRVGLMEEEAETHILAVDMHHIIADGMSLAVFVREFMALYKGETLPPLKLQYKDFTLWQNREKKSELMQKQGAYWRRHLGGDPDLPVLNLPLDYPRPVFQDFEGATVTFQLEEEDARRLNRLASEQELTLYMLLLAGFYIFLAKISGQEDIIVGGPAAGRRHADLENIIGMFVNTLALRNYPVSNKTLRAFLAEIKSNTLAAFENQDYLFEDLAAGVAVRRDTGRNPLFDVLLSFQNLDIPAVEIPGLTLTAYPHEEKRSKFDLSILAHEEEERLVFRLEYCAGLFKPDTATRFTRYFKQVLRAIPGVLDGRLADIEIISEKEKEHILLVCNDTDTDYPRGKTIHRLFEEQALATPDRIAVFSHGRTRTNTDHNMIITYRQLNAQAGHLAGLLIEKGVLADDIIGIMGYRTIETITGIMGILKAGGAYLPIDPDYPQERIDYMLKDSGVKILLGNEDCRKKIIVNCQLLMGPPQAPFHHSSFIIHHSNHLAYIMYTSGSTGKPKGVMATHRNVVRLVKNTNYAALGSDTRILQTGAPVFDATTFEIWGSLLNGGQLVLASKETILDAVLLGRVLKTHGVNTLWLSAPLFNQLLQQDIEMFASLRYLLVGGDVLSPGHINKVRHRFPLLRMINGYGPTENTTFSATHLIDVDYSINIPIGRPISNSTAYIVDKNDRLQPVGIYGELLVGGDGVALGYMNNPELTVEKFIDLHHSSFIIHHLKLYRTGDLARWLSDGTIEFLGRIDRQVKIRGFRVELGEIESQLLNISNINEAIVLVKENRGGEKCLCAYIVADKVFDQTSLREILAGKLPDYMIPAYLIFLESMPLNPNGKIDRRALPEPKTAEDEDYEVPGDDIEKRLAEIWSEILEIDKNRIGRKTNFFHSGGHSLKAGQVIARIAKEFHINVPLAEIFTKPTLMELAAFIKTAVKGVFAPIRKAPEKAYYPVSSAQKRLYVLQQMDEQGIYYNMPTLLVLEETDGQIDGEKIEMAFLELIRRHESLRTSFEMKGTETVQRIHDNVAFEIEYENSSTDYTDYTDDKNNKIPHSSFIIHHFIRAFDLLKAPLMRVGLANFEKNKYLLMVDIHHIIADGVSMGIMMREFTALYAGKNLPPLNLQYKDYCHWKDATNKKQEIQKQQDYWLKQFQGGIPRLKMPIDFERPAVPTFEGSSVQFEIDASVTGALHRLAQEEDVTLYMALTAVVDIFLAKITGQEDILIGTVAAGRNHPGLEGIIGMFVNTLVLRSYPSRGKTFREFLQEVKTGTLETFENQDYPFEELVEQLGIARNTTHTPLFDVMFSLDSLDLQSLEIPGLKITPFRHESSSSKFDITIMVHTGDTVIFTLEYRSKLFSKEKIDRFPGYIKDIVAEVLGNRDIRLGDIPISVDLAMAKGKELEQTFNF